MEARHLFRASFPETLGGMKVRMLRGTLGPFSFFRWIFVNRESVKSDETKEILAHERTHVGQWHSVDVLLMEVLTAVCWWNPCAWLMKREVRQIWSIWLTARSLSLALRFVAISIISWNWLVRPTVRDLSIISIYLTLKNVSL